MKRKIILGVILWLTCGYVGGAEFAGHMYGEFGHGEFAVDTKGGASREAILLGVATGPLGMFVGFCLSEHAPMWDWPKHIFEYGPPDRSH